MKCSLCWGLSAAAVVGLCGTRSLAAQTDYRNLDEGRPTRVEDAFPVERYAFEFLTSYALEREPGGGIVHAFVPELEYGLVANGELGIAAPVGILDEGGITRAGLSGLRAFALYNFNSESAAVPALALRADVRLPAGSFAGGETRVTLKGIATRSWGRQDRKSTRLNSSHSLISYAVFCLKKKTQPVLNRRLSKAIKRDAAECAQNRAT